jgi:polyisoprenyl-phosphate glycosyltransferase
MALNNNTFQMPILSFILPVHNEEDNIKILYDRIINLKKSLPKYSFELIFVNDFSTDKSFEVMQKLHKKDSEQVKIINFSKNYGHQIAVTAAQDYANGDAVIIMDTDLQDPPEVCIELVRKYEEGFDVVYAQRSKYKSSFTKQLFGFVFYRLLKTIASVDIPVDTGDFRLLSKRVNLEMRKYKEKSRYLRAISSLIGFKQTAVQFVRAPRLNGEPSYNFTKSLKLAMDGITSFSLFPIRFISFFGILISSASLMAMVSYIAYVIFFKGELSAWGSILLIIIFMGGIQMFMLGIIGEYIGRIFIEVLNRPLYTVADLVGLEEKRK